MSDTGTCVDHSHTRKSNIVIHHGTLKAALYLMHSSRTSIHAAVLAAGSPGFVLCLTTAVDMPPDLH